MRMNSILAIVALGICGSASGLAQLNLSFAYQGSADPAPVTITAGGVIPFADTNVGATTATNLKITNLGTQAVSLTTAVNSNPAFTTPSSTPLPIQPNATGSVTINFNPKGSGTATASFSVHVLSPDTTLNFVLSGNGVAPSYVTSYVLNPGGNQIPIADGGTLTFPATQVSSTSTATVTVSNLGTGSGIVRSVTPGEGSVFAVSGLPLLPATLKPNTSISFTLSFTPNSRGAATGGLIIVLDTATETLKLAGQGVGASFTVENITQAGVVAIPPNGTIPFPDTAIGKNATTTVRIRNDGDLSGQLTLALVGSNNYTLANLVPLPVSLAPGASTQFTAVFTPTEIGSITAQLLINNIIFINLSGTGLGANLTFSVAIGSGTTAVVNGGTIFFPNTVAGSTAAATFTITNSGNIAATVTSVSVPASAFSITGSVPLPLSLPPAASANIGLLFSPNAIGALTGTLSIDNQTFGLRGTGLPPGALPSYSFVGVGGTADPLQQPAIGLQFASAYTQDVTGTLTITFTPDAVVDDPAIQFATGGRTVNFRIPANTTNAVFGQASQVQFQSGTVSGTITITPSFAVAGVDVTPKPPTQKTVLIAATAPLLRNLQVGTRTATSFELLITGYSTPRSLTGLQLNFTASPGSSLAGTSFPVNVDGAFSAWYASTASQTAGSQFTASVTINVSGNVSAVQSASVTASNAKGTSNAVSVNLQ